MTGEENEKFPGEGAGDKISGVDIGDFAGEAVEDFAGDETRETIEDFAGDETGEAIEEFRDKFMGEVGPGEVTGEFLGELLGEEKFIGDAT